MKPWCGGIESGGATGWLGHRLDRGDRAPHAGGDVYDKWVTHAIPFDSPEITERHGQPGRQDSRTPKYVNGGFGGVKSIATTAFQEAGLPILNGKCAMHRQASFYANFWEFRPGDHGRGRRRVRLLPPGDRPGQGKPVVGGGEFVTAFADRPEVQAVQTYLASAEFATAKASKGTWVSANSGVPLDTYVNPIDALSAKYLTDPTGTFRFDASDLMPAAVGAGSFWKEMIAWFAEDKATAEVLKAIDAAWPAS